MVHPRFIRIAFGITDSKLTSNMYLKCKSAIFCCIVLHICQLASVCVGESVKSPVEFQSSLNDRDINQVLRKRSVELSAGDANIDRNVLENLPKPSMFRWFPKHDMPPTDSPEVPREELQGQPKLENESGNQNKTESGNKSFQVEAVFQGGFSMEIEDSIEQNDDEESEDPMEPSRKPNRERRDVRSLIEVRRRNAEIIRRRQEIAEQARNMQTTTTIPRTNRPTRRPTQRTNKKPGPNKRPPFKRQPTRRPGVRTTERTPISRRPNPQATRWPGMRTTRRTPETRRPNPRATRRPGIRTTRRTPVTRRPNQQAMRRPGIRTTRRTPVTRIPNPVKPTTPRRLQNVTTQPNRIPFPTSPTLSKENVTSNNSTTKSLLPSKTPATRTSFRNRKPGFVPPQRRSGSVIQKKRTSQTTSVPKRKPRNSQRNRFSKPKSTRIKTVVMVRPLVYKRTTETITRALQPKYDTPQNRNNYQRLAFSDWGSWSPCNAKGCGATGRQTRTRTCFGDRLTAADYAICNYNALVKHRQCRGRPCVTPTGRTTTTVPTPMKRRSRWSAWSKCSVTCGTGGQQTRTRFCYEIDEDNSDDVIPINCRGDSIERRPCQYSVSCPEWDAWSSWSSCSKSCGADGVSFRDRKCIVKRYLSFGQKNGNGQRRQFDSVAAASKPGIAEPSKSNKKNAVKYSMQSPAKPIRNSQGLVYLKKDGQLVFIVDAPRQDAQLPSQKITPEFHEDEVVEEFVDFELCAEVDGFSEEERRCVLERCPAEWGEWSEWSDCSVTCGLGISRRERPCSGDTFSDSCIGRKFAYRRCYAAPCWNEWTNWVACSVTCGSDWGFTKRTRQCLGTTSLIPEYTDCEGSFAEVDKCTANMPCAGDTWGTWGPFEECSVSCDGGYRRRARECLTAKCSGPSEDFGRCNIQECPTWSRWSAYSCCTVSCGHGMRKRTRHCVNGKAGKKGCIGKVADFQACYREPCNSNEKSVLGSFRCGIGSVSNLKTVAKLRIFGGTKSAAHDWPWQVSWQHKEPRDSEWQHFCGATLIHPRWVITASHCTEESDYIVNHRNPGEDWSVMVGMVKLYRDGKRYFVDRIFIHPKYEYKSVTKNDIALLKLRKMVPITKEVMPACLPRGTRPAPGESCYITGWGYTTSEPKASLSLSLREASVPIMKFPQCRTLGDYYRYFLDSTIHMCAGNAVTASVDSCTGDSGGPLVCSKNKRWYLGAVTSFGFADCGTPGHVGIYAPMDTYEPWVRNIIETHTYEKC